MSTLAEFKYGYDRASNRLYRRDEVAHGLSAGFDELYGYDGLDRLTSCARGQLNSGNTAISGSPTLTQNWTLDPLGNWNRFQQGVVNALDQTREQNEVNEITDIDKTVGADWPTPSYDANGNTTSFPDPRSLTFALSATYDAWNRLVKLENGGTVAEYQYDGRNRRIIKTTDSVTQHYYYSDQWQVLEERSDTDPDVADRQYVWGMRYVDDLVLRDRASARLYALSDAMFSVVAITDDDGAVVERFAYEPYGQSEALDPDFTSYSGTDYEWEYRFTGRELDLESRLQINRARYFASILGDFLTRDSFYQDGMNLYLYACANPVNGSDPFGRQMILEPILEPVLEPVPIFEPIAEPIVQPKPIFDPTPGFEPKPILDPVLHPPTSSQQCPPTPPLKPKPETPPKGPNPDDFKEPDRTRTEPWKYPNSNRGNGSDCTDKELERYNYAVSDNCGKPGSGLILPACSTITFTWAHSCTDLDILAKNWSDCAAARRNRENKCFRGGDKGHQIQIALADYQHSYCRYLMRYKNCRPQDIVHERPIAI